MEKYTVVIPTKNNIDTLRHTLTTCLNQQYQNFEIIISDNCSVDGTGDMIRSINDSRIKYLRTPRPLSMTQNFEFALSHAREGFVMCIGADDGLMPNAINYVNDIVEKYGVLAVSCQYAHYFWPNVPVAEHGRLTLYGLNVPKNTVEIRESAEWLKKTLAFETALYICDLPNLYYGFVHRSIIDKGVKDNIYFRSITPDAYSAFATAIHLKTYAYSLRPFCIAGISGKSNGLSQMLSGDIAKSFITENAHPIHSEFVFSPAFEVIMGEAFYQLKDAFPVACASYKVDIRLMLKKAVQHNKGKTAAEVFEAAQQMAVKHHLNFGKVKDTTYHKLARFSKLTLKMFRSYLSNGSWFLGMVDSEKFGVQNVADAALVLTVLASANEGNKFETVKSKFLNRIKTRIGVKQAK